MNAETPASVAHRQDALDRAAVLAHEASLSARAAMHSACKIDSGTASAGEAKRASESAWDCLQMLLRAGASSPIGRNVQSADHLALSLLATLVDPESNELLLHLEQALAVAERIDARRGRVVAEDIPLSPGESRGTDLAETISEIALRVRVEVYGLQGRD